MSHFYLILRKNHFCIHKNISRKPLSFTSYCSFIFIYLFGVLRRFQHCTRHITTGSWKGRGNQYIQFIRGLYCKLPTNGKQLPAFPLEAMAGIEPRPQRWEARVLPLCYRVPLVIAHLRPRILFTVHKTSIQNTGFRFVSKPR